MNSQKTLHTSPFRASYGVSFVSISTEIDRVIKGFYCNSNDDINNENETTRNNAINGNNNNDNHDDSINNDDNNYYDSNDGENGDNDSKFSYVSIYHWY